MCEQRRVGNALEYTPYFALWERGHLTQLPGW